MWSKYFNQIFRLLLFIFCVTLYLSLAHEYRFVQDDAYISFRYSENFVEGNGLVFNIGEKVEGYTNFLWVLILSFLKIIGVNLETGAQFLSIVFGVSVLTAAYFFGKKIIPSTGNKYLDTLLFFIPVYLLAFNRDFIYWSVSAMETSFFIFLILLGYLFAIIRKGERENVNTPAIISFILAALTRPEGLFFVITFIFFELFILKKEKRALIRQTVIILTPIFIHLLFRLYYYGYPLPNTFYAKSGLSEFFLLRGFHYFLDFVEANLFYGLVLVLPFLSLTRMKKTELFLFIVSLLFISSIVLIGGDVLPFSRLLLPVLPLIFILFTASSLHFRFNRMYTGIVLIVFCLFLGYFNFSRSKSELIDTHATEVGLVKKMKIYADWYNEQNDHNSSVALSTIGAFSYFTEARIIDLLGLTNEYIAHNPDEMKGITEPATRNWLERTYNSDYVISQNPTYIIFPAGAKPSAFPEASLFVNYNFQMNYYPQLIKSSNLNELLTVYTARNSKENYPVPQISNKCEDDFALNYITAANLFLKFTRNRDPGLIDHIIEKIDIGLSSCPMNSDDLLTLKGMTYYFTGSLNQAELNLTRAIAIDSLHMPAHFYLMNLYNKRNQGQEVIEHLKFLKKYSPDLFPAFELSRSKQ